VFTSLLVANRGEIACRILRTARRLGLRTIAVYSEADAGALHVSLADEGVCLGPAPAHQSYLAIDKILAAAARTDAEAIHPGYGFLSENPDFARACEAAGLIFVGPPVHAIETMGSKLAAKQLMDEAGVPVLPGYHGADQADETLAQHAAEVGFPLLIKASAGGGGKGMRLVRDASEFTAQLQGARREAQAAFGDDAVLLERYLTTPKHIEVQLMADTQGHVIHLFERDCSVQRRHQKVIEEAPGPTVSASLRQQLGETAIMVAKKVGYVGAGTVEFIAQDGAFYFMEMNTRLQVEHPVTELISGLDLVELQLRVAAGEPLPVTQDALEPRGHAVEVRLYAENPARKFLPSTGRIAYFSIPDELRVDSGVRAGDLISPHYDPMLAKLIAYGPDRAAALSTMTRALRDAKVAGVDHNLGYLIGMLEHPAFTAGTYTTSIAKEVHADVLPNSMQAFAILAALAVLPDHRSEEIWSNGSGFRCNLPAHREVCLRQGKRRMTVSVTAASAQVEGVSVSLGPLHKTASGEVAVRIDGAELRAMVLKQDATLHVMCNGHTERFIDETDDIDRFHQKALAAGGVAAPMPGQVIAVHVSAGDAVREGQALVVVEAMKMEHSVVAPKAGKIARVCFAPGDRVEEGTALVEFV